MILAILRLYVCILSSSEPKPRVRLSIPMVRHLFTFSKKYISKVSLPFGIKFPVKHHQDRRVWMGGVWYSLFIKNLAHYSSH